MRHPGGAMRLAGHGGEVGVERDPRRCGVGNVGESRGWG